MAALAWEISTLEGTTRMLDNLKSYGKGLIRTEVRSQKHGSSPRVFRGYVDRPASGGNEGIAQEGGGAGRQIRVMPGVGAQGGAEGERHALGGADGGWVRGGGGHALGGAKKGRGGGSVRSRRRDGRGEERKGLPGVERGPTNELGGKG